VINGPASGASRQDVQDCQADDPDRRIAGCTRIIQDQRDIANHARAFAFRCYRVEVNGNTATYYEKDGSGSRYTILKGNPKGL
jgi:hypothetical protein